MYNSLDEFGHAVRSKREAQKQTQKELAEKLGMSHRTIMEVEICRSNPKFETVVLLARELNISLDALVFPETASPNMVPKCVIDFFKGKTESESQKFISLCKLASDFNSENNKK